MALPIIEKEVQLDFNQGVLNGVEVVNGVLQLKIVEGGSQPIYAHSGTVEFTATNLGKLYTEIKSVSSIKNIPEGTTLNIYTSTSTDNVNFSDYSLVDANGLITSPQGRYIRIKAELTGKNTTAPINQYIFDNTDSSKFEYDEQLIFDGSLYLKTIYNKNMVQDTGFTDGVLFRLQLEKNNYEKIESIVEV